MKAQKIKILIVDDTLNARRTVKNILMDLNCTFTEAQTGEKALEQIKKKTFDVIILDKKLPGIDGMETFKRARSLRQNLCPVIILTRYPETTSAQLAGNLFAFDYIHKQPLDPQHLKETVIRASSAEVRLRLSMTKPCFKHRITGCLNHIPFDGQYAFVGMPFRLNNVYKNGIKKVVQKLGLQCYRADEEKRADDLSCKICGALQSSRLAIMEISKPNRNVFLETGLAYAYGKQVVLLRRTDSPTPPSDLAGIEYISYTTIKELRMKLNDYLLNILAIDSGK